MIGFIGVGNMAGAILSGILEAGFVSVGEICLFDADSAKYQRFPGALTCASARELVELSDTVFFSVKPQVLPSVLAELSGVQTGGKVFVSICAAVSTDYVRASLPGSHVVRAMPNTPMLYGKGVCALSRSADVSDAEFERIHRLFSVLGTTAIIDEAMQNPIIAVTGSSPAYLFYLADAMAEAAQESGFSYEESTRWIADVFEGAAVMLRDGGMSAKELCRMVCSPGGTTLEAMRVFEEARLSDTVKEAMRACTRRAQQLQK